MEISELQKEHYDRVNEVAKLSSEVASLKAEILNLSSKRETLADEAKKLVQLEVQNLLKYGGELMEQISQSSSDVETYISWTKSQLQFVEECNLETSKLILILRKSTEEISEYLEKEHEKIRIKNEEITRMNNDIQDQIQKISLDRKEIERQRVELDSKRKALSNAYKTLRK